jgi:Carboxypeptidase regulatory-like domain
MKAKDMMRSIITFLTLLALLHTCSELPSAKAETCISETLKVGRVQGRVLAAWLKNEDPISNANLELKEFRNDEWRTVSKVVADEQGYFKFENVPSGEYELYVTATHLRSFGTRVRVRQKANSQPNREIVVYLDGVECGAAKVRRIKRK